MALSVFMISADRDAVRPGSPTARRLAGYAALGVDLRVSVRSPMALVRSLRDACPGGVVTAQDPFEAGLLGWIAARLRGAAFEVQMHGDFLNPAWAAEAWHRPLRLHLARFLLRRADGVRVVSMRVARSLTGIVPADHIVIVPVPAQTPVGEDVRVDANQVRYAGRFSPEKNLPMLVRAFARAAVAHPSARLVLVGDGQEMPAVRAAIAASGMANRIRIAPWTEGSAIGDAGIIVVPSRHESWSRLAVEAARAGRAVVMTDVGCAGEVIVDGESGWVVPPGDETVLAAALGDALSRPDEARRRGENARRIAQELPDADEIARRVVAAWKRLAGAS